MTRAGKFIFWLKAHGAPDWVAIYGYRTAAWFMLARVRLHIDLMWPIWMIRRNR